MILYIGLSIIALSVSLAVIELIVMPIQNHRIRQQYLKTLQGQRVSKRDDV